MNMTYCDPTRPVVAASMLDVGTVIDRMDDEPMVQVRTNRDDQPVVVWAQLAIENAEPLQSGDQVLLAGGPDAALFVIGITRRVSPRSHTIDLADGRSIVVAPELSHVRILDQQNETVLNYDGATNSLRICAPRTNVHIESTTGDLSLRAHGKVQIQGEQGVEVSSPRFAVESVDTDLRGENLEAVYHRQRFIGHRIDYVFETLMSTVRNAFQNVAGLFQVRAKRSRSIVEETSESHAREMRMNAEDDFKVGAGHIHLG